MIYRQISIEIWNDPWFLDLEHQGKLLFIYLFSNNRSNLLGMYEISRKAIAFETDLALDDINRLLTDFNQAGKVLSNGTWIWVPKLLTRNSSNLRSPKTRAHLVNGLKSTPDSCPFKAEWVDYFNRIIVPQYGIDTISIPHPYPADAGDTFCSATAPVPVSVPVPVSDLNDTVEESTADAVFLQVRGGAVNTLDVDILADLIRECEAHRTDLPRGSPGADASGDDWVKAAILEGNASRNQGKLISLKYISAILDRWMAEGFKAKWKAKGKDDEETVGGL